MHAKLIKGARSQDSWPPRRDCDGQGHQVALGMLLLFHFFHVGLGYLMWSHKKSLRCTNMICAHLSLCVILQIKVKEKDQGSIPSSATCCVTCGIHFSFMLQLFHLRNQRNTTHLQRCKNIIRGCIWNNQPWTWQMVAAQLHSLFKCFLTENYWIHRNLKRII